MDRVLRDTQAKIYVSITGADGAAVAPLAAPTVTVVRDSDGTTAATGTASAVAGSTTQFSFTLTPAQIPEVDLLTATWVATVEGVASQNFITQVEVIGGHLCSLEAIATAIDAATAPTTAELREARAWAERKLEDACGVAFRPSYASETVNGSGSTGLFLANPRSTSLLAGSISTVALTPTEIAAVTPLPSGGFYRSAKWAAGDNNVRVAYVHGHSVPPEPVTQAAVKLARHYLTSRPSRYDERATRIDTDEASYSLVTEGIRGAVTPIPEVNQVIADYRYVSI